MIGDGRGRASMLVAVAAGLLVGGCDIYDDLPGRPAPNPAPVAAANTPDGFERIWAARCAGCHGADGVLGAARPMKDAAYLASIPRSELVAVIRDGTPGTRMPAFGGNAVDPIPPDELEKFVDGMIAVWGPSDSGANPDPSRGIPWRHEPGTGDAARGATLFEANCRSCHPSSLAADATLQDGASGSVTDPFYLRLVSDQHLRSSIVFGRADLGMPGAAGPFRGPDGKTVDRTLDADEVADLVAYMASFRKQWPSTDEREDGAR